MLLLSPAPPAELGEYLRRPDGSYRLTANGAQWTLQSQTWKGMRWTHDLEVAQPDKPSTRGVAILVITGDGPFARDRAFTRMLVEKSRLPVATLYDVPNQPLWDKREDGLIAFTFGQYLESGDATWPLLFPMTRAAIRAMDAVQTLTAKSANPIHRFVVTGASKRGWTTWLVGASGDKRVVGIAPMVYDNLNIPVQLAKMKSQFGGPSDRIDDYTESGLLDALQTEAGKRLLEMVDPWSYRSAIKAPTLIVNGANDAYWPVDALATYWEDLKQPKWATIVPNAGHNLGDGRWATAAISAFARSCAGEYAMPKVRLESKSARLTAPTGDGLAGVEVWMAEAPKRDFRQAQWTVYSRGTTSAPLPSAGASHRAVLAVGVYKRAGQEFRLATPVRVLPAR